MKVKQEGSLSLAHLHGEQSFTTLLANFLSFFSQVGKLFVESTIHFVKHWLNIKKKLQYNFCMALSLTNATITKRKT